MTEIDYTLLEGIATKVEVSDGSIFLHRDAGSICIMRDGIQEISDEGTTIRIRTIGSVINLYKAWDFFHVTTLTVA